MRHSASLLGEGQHGVAKGPVSKHPSLIELKWTKKDHDENVEYIVLGSYAFAVEGNQLFFTHPNQ